MARFKFRFLVFIISLFFGNSVLGQNSEPKLPFLERPDTLNKPRFWTAVAGGSALYTTGSVILWNSWYKDYPITKFHTFNDWGEWEDMDKAGHVFTAWVESYNSYRGALWTGMKRRNAMWVGVAVGMGLQLTVETMDGFSKKWGFSWGDMAFNTVGTSLFVAQELIWEEQRFIFKVSSNHASYPDDPILSVDGGQTTTLKIRAEELYGGTAAQTFFKDYNALTIWLSANIHSFLKNREESKFPKWLNVAVGYGAENMFGGFENEWSMNDSKYFLDPVAYPRYRQFYLSFDVDLSKLPVKNRLARLALGLLNWIKIPAPALEVNTLGKVEFHPFFF